MAYQTTGQASTKELSTGELVSRLSQDMSTLIRDELRLAQIEATGKAKKLGLGAGLFGGAGVLSVFGLGVLIAAATLGLANVVPGWLAAVIVGTALLLFAGVVALIAKQDVSAGSPPMPNEAVSGLQTDVKIVRKGLHR